MGLRVWIKKHFVDYLYNLSIRYPLTVSKSRCIVLVILCLYWEWGCTALCIGITRMLVTYLDLYSVFYGGIEIHYSMYQSLFFQAIP